METTVNESTIDKAKKFVKDHSKVIIACVVGAGMYRLGTKTGYKIGYRNGKNFGFGVGAAAGCEALLTVDPEKYDNFLKGVRDLWGEKL